MESVGWRLSAARTGSPFDLSLPIIDLLLLLCSHCFGITITIFVYLHLHVLPSTLLRMCAFGNRAMPWHCSTLIDLYYNYCASHRNLASTHSRDSHSLSSSDPLKKLHTVRIVGMELWCDDTTRAVFPSLCLIIAYLCLARWKECTVFNYVATLGNPEDLSIYYHGLPWWVTSRCPLPCIY